MKMNSSAERALSHLREQGLTLATAESCTGGLIGKLLTDVPGASQVYKGGVISYTNEVKHALLGVEQETLDVCTAVSRMRWLAARAGAAARTAACRSRGWPGRTEMGRDGRWGWSISRSTPRASPSAESSI